MATSASVLPAKPALARRTPESVIPTINDSNDSAHRKPPSGRSAARPAVAARRGAGAAAKGLPLSGECRLLELLPWTTAARESAFDLEISRLNPGDRSLGEKDPRVGKNNPGFHGRHRRIDGDDRTIDDAHRSLSMPRTGRSLPAMQGWLRKDESWSKKYPPWVATDEAWIKKIEA